MLRTAFLILAAVGLLACDEKVAQEAPPTAPSAELIALINEQQDALRAQEDLHCKQTKPWSSPPTPSELLLKEFVERPRQAPPDWTEYNVGVFSFKAPAGLKKTGPLMIDSIDGGYADDDVRVWFRRDMYSSVGLTCLSSANTEIDHRAARVEVAGNTIHVETARIFGSGLRFSVSVKPLATRVATLREAMTIVQSIRFITHQADAD